MSDHELDKLFAKKLGKRTFAYNPKAWAAMEEMLDGPKSNLAFFWRSAAAILLMGSIVAVIALQNQPLKNIESEPFSLSPISVTPNLNLEPPTASQVLTKTDRLEESTVPNHGTVATSAGSSPTSSKHSRPAISNGKNLLEAEKGSTVASSFDELSHADAGSTRLATETDQLLAISALPMASYTATPLKPILAEGPAQPKYQRKTPWGTAYLSVGGLMSSVDMATFQGYGVSLGLGYEKRLSRHWAIMAEANFVLRNNPGIAYKNDSIFYGFVEERVTNTREVQRLSHLEIPLLVQYKWNARSSISIGGYASLLLKADMLYSREEHNFQYLVLKTQREAPAEKNLIAPYNYGLIAQYRYLLSPSMQLGIRASQGLTDVSALDQRHLALTDVRILVQYAF